MIFNHFKYSVRTIYKFKIYSAIKMVGLAIGIAAAMLIFRMLKYETSFNKNFSNYDRVARIVHIQKDKDQEEDHGACTPIPAMDEMQNTIPQFDELVRIKEMWSGLTVPDPAGGNPLKKMAVGNEQISFFVENSFFEIFNLKWLAGNQKTALSTPGTIVLTRQWAEKCFGSWDKAMGETLLIDNVTPVQVEGVVDDLPPNCDFPIQYLVSYETLKSNPIQFFHSEHWGSCSSNDQVYVLLSENADRKSINAELAKIGGEHYSNRAGEQIKFHYLQDLSDLHYNQNIGHSGTHYMTRSRLTILSMIGILILFMACFNFINLATAQATLRIKEVGVRKTLGSNTKQLVTQFMVETTFIVFVSVLLGSILAYTMIPWLSQISHVPVTTDFLTDPNTIIFLGITVVGVTILAGLYPSVILSNSKPSVALYKKGNNPKSNTNLLRKTLVVLQFAIAQTLIIGAIITVLQIDFIQSKDLGFSKDLVYTFTINTDSSSLARQSKLKHMISQIPGVQSLSFSSDQPLSGNTWSTNFRFGDHPEDEPFSVTLKFCDEEYQTTYGLNLLAGNWLAKSDTMREAVVNQTLLTMLGMQNPQEAINQKIRIGSRRVLNIAGVVQDFHTHSMRTAHMPLVMSTRSEFYWEAGVKIERENVTSSTTQIQNVFDRVYPEQVFEGHFLDERIAMFYEDERNMANTSRAFGLLAILISCLGLFGLAAHTANLRTKEIGIRKVLGSTTIAIVTLLSKEFLKLVLFSLIFAVPIGYYIMQKWLENFVYRIEMDWWIFLLTGLITIIIAFFTVGYQSAKAALANPINSIKSE